MEDKKEKLLEIMIENLNEHMHSIKLLISHVSKPLTVDDRGLAGVLRHLREALNQYKFPQILGEMEFICKRLDKIEKNLEKIKKDGIKKKIKLEFNCDGYELVKKPYEYREDDQIEEPKDPNKILNELLSSLLKREKDVIIHRFGLFEEKKKTLIQTGKIIGVSRERARQIESGALRKLRHFSRIKLVAQINHKQLKIALIGKQQEDEEEDE